MPQKPGLDFSCNYQLMQSKMHVDGCVCNGIREVGCSIIMLGSVTFLPWQNFFFPDMSMKHRAQILLIVLTARPPNQTPKDFNCFANM